MSTVDNLNSTKIYTERQVLSKLLRHYKEKTWLWDPQHEHYGHKVAREKGYKELLETYRLLDENATVDQVKKKIEHMKSAYRRERNKVLSARKKGSFHRPCLWYFEHLTFLNNDLDLNSTGDYTKQETSVVYLQENEDGEYDYEEVPKKKPKLDEILLSSPSSPQNSNDDATGNDNTEQEEHVPTTVAHQETEAFGKTIGLQLLGLDSTQRFIAEKLISEVIFYARLDQLKTNSCIAIDSD